MHFLLSDRVSSPPEAAPHFSESLALAPLSFSFTSAPAMYPNISTAARRPSGAGAAGGGGCGEEREKMGVAGGGAGGGAGGAGGVVLGDFNKVGSDGGRGERGRGGGGRVEAAGRGVG